MQVTNCIIQIEIGPNEFTKGLQQTQRNTPLIIKSRANYSLSRNTLEKLRFFDSFKIKHEQPSVHCGRKTLFKPKRVRQQKEFFRRKKK